MQKVYADATYSPYTMENMRKSFIWHLASLYQGVALISFSTYFNHMRKQHFFLDLYHMWQ